MNSKITALADSIAETINPDSRGLADSKTLHICTLCSGPASTFTDSLSRKEYGISGMCQKCQNRIFAPTPDTNYFGPLT